ncbi:GTPase IMAP family member 8-like isoform X2 [Notothenia coriiceps]|uniref:GTPase IMAP family member 8 n=1 Tax=Notothenia coriiceps TaxID=8208 RepID=A0A6I9Q5Z0_9TELE|nr:PREDICTED: GTPase IMAP family member 8-like isoform X2 [Notothenia coriiceps]
METAATGSDDPPPVKQSSIYGLLPPNMSELRVVLLGNSWYERSSVGNYILGKTMFDTEKEPDHCLKVSRQLKGKEIVLINTPDLLHPNTPKNKLTEYVNDCVSLSDPGPHVFLLLLQPEEFTEDHKLRLCRVLEVFGDQSFDHALILISPPTEESSGVMDFMQHPLLKDMIAKCRNRYLIGQSELLTRLGQTTEEIFGHFEGSDEEVGLIMIKCECIKAALNLVLCGRRGAGKTSAAKAILGQTELHSASNSSECVKHQGEVCGRRVSLVQLPALCGKPQQEVMEESFRCISLCDPEGVHAFVLVLPVGPLTDEDKGELETIQNTFSSQVNDFTMILFTVETDPTAPAVVEFIQKNKDIQELCQSCGERYAVLNIEDQQQIPELLDAVEQTRVEGSRCFTMTMFTKAQMKKVGELDSVNRTLKARKKSEMGEDDERERLRMVLIGKAVGVKSTIGNTILGEEHFRQKFVTTVCQRATGEIHGRSVAVVNTPSLFETPLSDDDLRREVRKCLSILAPGPHVFLLALQIGNVTLEEKHSVELIKKYFGKKSQDSIIIILTRGDEPEGKLSESYADVCGGFVKKLINDCRGRYQVFNKGDTEGTQVRELLTKIETMEKENGGCCYTEGYTAKQVERILKEKEEERKRKEENLRKKHEDDMKTLERKIKEEERKLRGNQLKEKDQSINKEREKRKQEREEVERGRKKQEDTTRQEWKRKLDALEGKVQYEREQNETYAKKLEQIRREVKRDQESWNRERKDTWERIHEEDKQSLEEWKVNYRNLQEEYHYKRRKYTYCIVVLMLSLSYLLSYIFLS